jgi:hypothetical protein
MVLVMPSGFLEMRSAIKLSSAVPRYFSTISPSSS